MVKLQLLLFVNSGKYFLALYPACLPNITEFKSKETKNESLISLIAFKIIIDEPPKATPISRHFLGLYLLINEIRLLTLH